MSIKHYKSKSTLFIPQLRASLPAGTVFALNEETGNIEVNGVVFPVDRNISLFIQHGFFAEIGAEELRAEQEAARRAMPAQATAANELPLMHISKKTIDLPDMYNKGGIPARQEYQPQQGEFTAENNYGLKGIVKMESTSHRLSLDGKPITASAEESSITTLNDGPSFVKPSADKIAEAKAYAEARKQQRLEQASKLQAEMNANGISRPLNDAEFALALSDNNKVADKTQLDSPVAVFPVAETYAELPSSFVTCR